MISTVVILLMIFWRPLWYISRGSYLYWRNDARHRKYAHLAGQWADRFWSLVSPWEVE